MSGNLTTSSIARQNILNNPYALEEMEKAAGVRGIPFENKRIMLKEQVAEFFEVTPRTLENYVVTHGVELTANGYDVVRGKRLKELKKVLEALDGTEIDFGTIKKSSVLSVFDFRAFLNLAMLLTDSERAKSVRAMILDIAIDTIQIRAGGSTKYINQRDADYLEHAFAGENYRVEFTDALRDFVDEGKWKYPNLTDAIYKAIFKEQSREYRKILQLDEKDDTRRTFYAEVVTLIAGFEHAVAVDLKSEHDRLNRRLSVKEAMAIVDRVASTPLSKPLVEMARSKMASRDYALRGVTHDKLGAYITSLPREDFERFLGTQSKELAKQIENAKDVMKRLKDR
jgi:hypothetical protein